MTLGRPLSRVRRAATRVWFPKIRSRTLHPVARRVGSMARARVSLDPIHPIRLEPPTHLTMLGSRVALLDGAVGCAGFGPVWFV